MAPTLLLVPPALPPVRLPSTRPATVLLLGHHDLDGYVSAALLGLAIRARAPQADFVTGTVDFHLRDVWPRVWADAQRGRAVWRAGARIPVPQALALADFPATPVPADVPLWFADHHPKPFALTPDDGVTEADYRARAERDVVIVERHGSCAELLATTLGQTQGYVPDAAMQEAIRAAHTSDTVAYASAVDAIDLTGFVQQCELLALDLPEPEAANVIARLIDGQTLEQALLAPHRARLTQLIADAQAAIAEVMANATQITPYAVVAELSPRGTAAGPAKFATYLDPEVQYSVVLMPRMLPGGGCRVSATLGRSKWARPLTQGVHPDFGKVAETIGGGGHPYAAGFRVEDADPVLAMAKARQMVADITPYLQPLPAAHPYADRATLPATAPAPAPAPAPVRGTARR